MRRILDCDFDNLDGRSRVFVPIGPPALPERLDVTVGERVLLDDGFGNTAEADVVEIDEARAVAYLAPDMDTFR